MSDDWYRAHGERLQVARRNLGIPEEDAAAAFDVTIRTYRKWEAGSVRPHQTRHVPGAVNFARTYGISLNWLFGCDGVAPPRYKLRLVS